MKRPIPTIKAEALEKGKFELQFVPYAKYPKRSGTWTSVEVAAVPTGGLFRFTTFVEENENEYSIADISYQLIPGVYPCDCPIEERVFLYKGDMDKLLRSGDAEYLELPKKEESEEKTIADMESVQKELDERLSDLTDEEEESDESVDSSTEEIDEDEAGGFPFDEVEDDEEADEGLTDDPNEIYSSDELRAAKAEGRKPRSVAQVHADEDKEESDDDGIDVSEMSPEEIRRRLNNRFNQKVEAPAIEDTKEEELEKVEEEKPSENKPSGSYIGAPANVSSHKEPYGRKETTRYDKKRDWENKNRDSRKNDKKAAKKEAKRAKRRELEQASQIDFASIVNSAFSKK